MGTDRPVRDILVDVVGTLCDYPYRAWHFGDSIAFEGMLAAGRALERPDLAGFVHGFARGWIATRTSFVPLDCTAAGVAMCDVAERFQDAALIDSLRGLAEYLGARPTIGSVYQTWERSPLRRPYGGSRIPEPDERLLADPGPGVFVDCLHFDPPFFARLGRLTSDTGFVDTALQQARGYISLLQNPSTGLFDHFHLERTGRSYIPGWGRGQGWALLGLLDVIAELPEGPGRADLEKSARLLVDAMIGCQRPDGHWDAVVFDPASGAESSTAAFMAVGFRRAVALGVVPADDVRAAAVRAYRAVVSDIAVGGILGGVSAEVWASTVPDHYSHVPRGFEVPWGQGPAADMLAEWMSEEGGWAA